MFLILIANFTTCYVPATCIYDPFLRNNQRKHDILLHPQHYLLSKYLVGSFALQRSVKMIRTIKEDSHLRQQRSHIDKES